jgi:hypothetical protein
MSLYGNIVSLVIIAFCFSCSSQQDQTVSRPSIYDAWDARYNYQAEDRKMVPLYNGREVGRIWGRDPQGRLLLASYRGTSSKNDEDLYSLHLQKMDKFRDRQWEDAKDLRTNKVKEMLAELEEVEEEDELVEIMIEDEEEEFIPPPSFIPSGFDLETVEDEAGTSSPGNEESAIELPFAPLP